ncbi:hypothetical protein ACXIUT_23845 [Achromobacter denitrificans]|jgi:hypothetical protein
MSVLLQMIQVNAPLHTWREFKQESRAQIWISKENSRKIAQIIMKQCGHADVINLVVSEFDTFPDTLRRDFSDLANSQGASSGNVRKGLQRINERLQGRLLRENQETYFNQRVESIDGVRYKRVRVDPARAGAMRKYGTLK